MAIRDRRIERHAKARETLTGVWEEFRLGREAELDLMADWVVAGYEAGMAKSRKDDLKWPLDQKREENRAIKAKMNRAVVQEALAGRVAEEAAKNVREWRLVRVFSP